MYRKLINSQRWVRLRRGKLSSDPLCERCLLADRTTPATEVHHLRPVETGRDRLEMESLCFDINNLQSLCHKCHKVAHSELRSYTKEEVQKRNKDRVHHFTDKFLKKG